MPGPVIRTAAAILACALAPAISQQSLADDRKYDPKTNPQPWVRPLDRQGFHLGFPLATVTPMLTPKDTDGLFEAGVEHIETDYYGPAHVHEELDETIIMIDGSAHIRLNDRDFTLTRGEWLHIPRGTIHSFKSTGSPAKWIILKSPPPPPPRATVTPECDRSAFTPEMVADVERMLRFYHDCLDDFFMVPDAGLPGTPHTPSSYRPDFEVRPWVRPLDRPFVHLGFPAASVARMLSGEETGGAFSGAIEHIEADYHGPAHVHFTRSETIIMIDGSARLRVDGTDLTLTEGQWLHIPPGNAHSFDSTGNPAKWIILQSPASSELVDDDFHMVPEAGLPGDESGR